MGFPSLAGVPPFGSCLAGVGGLEGQMGLLSAYMETSPLHQIIPTLKTLTSKYPPTKEKK